MHTRLLFSSSAAIGFFLLVACGDPKNSASTLSSGPSVSAAAASALTDADADADADADWARLTSSGAIPARLDGESDLVYFMRRVELVNLRRRELGLAFWDAYPDDSRRYSWLILTVHMPPYYAVDISEWADKESDASSANDAAVNIEALAAWDARYDELRAAFWSAPEIDDQQRRFLWFGELENALHELRNARARGEAIDVQTFLQDYLAFTAAYPNAFPDESALQSEAKTHFLMTTALFTWTFDTHRDLFGWTPESAEAFLTELEARRPTPRITGLRDHLAEYGTLPPRRIGGRPVSGMDDAQLAWRTYLPNMFHTSGNNGEAGIINTYKRLIDAQKRREIGLSLWERYPDPNEQVTWLRRLSPPETPLYHVAGIVDGIRAIAEGREDEIAIDPNAVSAWRARYADLRAKFWNDPTTMPENKRAWLEIELRAAASAMRPMRAAEPPAVDLARVHMKNIHTLANDFGGIETAADLGKDFVDYPDWFGIGEMELAAFVEPFRNSESAAARHLVASFDQRQMLKTTPLELTARTLDGETIDFKDLRGKLVYVDPWMTSCSGCIAAMPELHETYLAYKDQGFEFVSMLYDYNEHTAKRARRVVDSLGTTWPVAIGNELPGPRLPYLLLNRDGTVHTFHNRRSGPTLAELLDNILASEVKADEG